MGKFVIAAFRPKPGKEELLREVLRDHMPTLRKEGLITDRPAYLMQSSDGVYLEVFEWKSNATIDKAHKSETVRKLWARFEEACNYVPTGSVKGIDTLFPNFDSVIL